MAKEASGAKLPAEGTGAGKAPSPPHAIIIMGSLQVIPGVVSESQLREKLREPLSEDGENLAFLLDITESEQVEELVSTGRTETVGAFGKQAVTLTWCSCSNRQSHRRSGAIGL
jgi:hypothetical protein